jgi:hypothetical protein
MVAEPGSWWNRAPAAQKFKLLIVFVLVLVMTETSATAPSLIDTKLFGRPKGYSGNRNEWGQWKFAFKAYIGALSSEMLRKLDHAEKSLSSMPLGAFTPDE